MIWVLQNRIKGYNQSYNDNNNNHKISVHPFLTALTDPENYLVIGLTNTSPTIQPPTGLDYTVCGQYPPTGPVGVTITWECKQNLLPYRYLILQSSFTDVLLVACELQVFLRCKYNFTCDVCNPSFFFTA
jgi:hypothetical protein